MSSSSYLPADPYIGWLEQQQQQESLDRVAGTTAQRGRPNAPTSLASPAGTPVSASMGPSRRSRSHSADGRRRRSKRRTFQESQRRSTNSTSPSRLPQHLYHAQHRMPNSEPIYHDDLPEHNAAGLQVHVARTAAGETPVSMGNGSGGGGGDSVRERQRKHRSLSPGRSAAMTTVLPSLYSSPSYDNGFARSEWEPSQQHHQNSSNQGGRKTSPYGEQQKQPQRQPQPQQPPQQQHSDLIMFGDAPETGSVLTGWSQQELLSQSKKKLERRRRGLLAGISEGTPKKQRQRTKKRGNRILNISLMSGRKEAKQQQQQQQQQPGTETPPKPQTQTTSKPAPQVAPNPQRQSQQRQFMLGFSPDRRKQYVENHGDEDQPPVRNNKSLIARYGAPKTRTVPMAPPANDGSPRRSWRIVSSFSRSSEDMESTQSSHGSPVVPEVDSNISYTAFTVDGATRANGAERQLSSTDGKPVARRSLYSDPVETPPTPPIAKPDGGKNLQGADNDFPLLSTRAADDASFSEVLPKPASARSKVRWTGKVGTQVRFAGELERHHHPHDSTTRDVWAMESVDEEMSTEYHYNSERKGQVTFGSSNGKGYVEASDEERSPTSVIAASLYQEQQRKTLQPAKPKSILRKPKRGAAAASSSMSGSASKKSSLSRGRNSSDRSMPFASPVRTERLRSPTSEDTSESSMTSRAGSGRIGAIPRDDVAETDETRSVKNDRTGENSHSSNRNHKIHHNTETVGFHTESGELISPIRPARLSLALNEPNEEMAPIPMDRKVEQAARSTPVKSPTVSVQSLQPHTSTAELQKQRR